MPDSGHLDATTWTVTMATRSRYLVREITTNLQVVIFVNILEDIRLYDIINKYMHGIVVITFCLTSYNVFVVIFTYFSRFVLLPIYTE